MAGEFYFLKSFLHACKDDHCQLIYTITCIDLLGVTCPFDRWLREDKLFVQPVGITRVSNESPQPGLNTQWKWRIMWEI